MLDTGNTEINKIQSLPSMKDCILPLHGRRYTKMNHHKIIRSEKNYEVYSGINKK